jgi:hypothetical protein
VVNVEKSTGYKAKVENIVFNEKTCKAFHCNVDKWTPQQYKQMLKDWKTFRQEMKEPIYAFPPDAKVAKFAEKFGFKYIKDVRVGVKRKRMPMYIHEVE